MSGDWDNVILLSVDALRADHLSCYGYHRETSPRLDALASESRLFTAAHSASSHTREAVPALLTGEYPAVAVDSGYNLATDTVASWLSKRGFRTAGFHSNPYVSRAYGFDRGFEAFDDDLHLGQHKLLALAQRALDKLRNRHYARAAEINDRALGWLDALDDDPFFLWVHYMDTHGPYDPPARFDSYGERSPDYDPQSLYRRACGSPDSVTDADRRQLLDRYDGEIRHVDAQLGRFLDALRERDLLEESLVVVTADHGDAFGEHGYYGHPRYLHDSLTRVPLLVRPPGGSDDDTVSAPVSTLDVVATITDGDGPGRSLLGPVDEDRRVFQFARGEGSNSHLRRHAVRDRSGVCFCEHDVESGAVTVSDCSGDELRGALRAHVDRHRDGADSTAADAGGPTAEIDRRLEALGYKE